MQQISVILIVTVCILLLLRRMVRACRREASDCGCGGGKDCPHAGCTSCKGCETAKTQGKKKG